MDAYQALNVYECTIHEQLNDVNCQTISGIVDEAWMARQALPRFRV